MSKKSFALRIDPQILEAMQSWADEDLRSINSQIEFILRQALRQAGRLQSRPIETFQEQQCDSEFDETL